jgi:Tol biopolymer transport system component
MNLVKIFFVLGLAGPLMSAAYSQQPIGLFEAQMDVGGPKGTGSCVYDSTAGKYEVAGSGMNMWIGHDEFHFVYKQLKGDFILTARGRFLGEGADPHRKLGWMIRRSLDPDAAYVDVAVHGEGLTSMQFRRAAGRDTEEKKSSLRGADVIQLERRGGTFVMSVAQFGQPFVSEALAGVDLSDEVYVGLFVCAHNAEVVERGEFDNVRITVPAKPDFVPYRDYIGSNLEILDLATGRREIIYHQDDSIQAPNWTPDGKALIYNGGGRLFRFDLETRKPTPIDTGHAKANNNDHVLSFDGRQIGISNHTAELGGKSIVYTLPVEGGTPRQITKSGPSYLHSWSPDGKWLLFTGDRDGNLDIYKISVEGGDEIRLTDSQGVDDGSEFTPDGAWIYFNSTRTGRMQIWRMRPDGSGQEQVTHDDLNNWFPHISPDGQRIVFLSFLPDVSAKEHPFYKQVYVRMMPSADSEPKVLAYVYGGQGSINVPSWSPDSRRIAFVSNSQ